MDAAAASGIRLNGTVARTRLGARWAPTTPVSVRSTVVPSTARPWAVTRRRTAGPGCGGAVGAEGGDRGLVVVTKQASREAGTRTRGRNAALR
ncbi:hypothetical protein GCM10023221_36270 [Luteimicrobium xylanilyticum]